MQWKTIDPADLGISYEKNDSKITQVVFNVEGRRIKVTGNWDSVCLYEEKIPTRTAYKASVRLNTEFSKEEIHSKTFDDRQAANDYINRLEVWHSHFETSVEEIEEKITGNDL